MLSGLDPETFLVTHGVPLLRRDNPVTLDELETGDILLFRGIGANSRLAMRAIGEPFSHTCVVLQCPVTGRKYVYESGPPQPRSGKAIIRRKGNVFGAHLMTLHNKVTWTDAFIAVHRLYKKDPATGKLVRASFNTPAQQKYIWTWLARDLGRLYDYNHVPRLNDRFNVTKIGMPLMHDIIEDTNTASCPTLTVLTVEMLGILKVDENHATRKDIYCNEFIDMNSPFFIMQDGYYYDHLEVVKRIPNHLFFDPPLTAD